MRGTVALLFLAIPAMLVTVGHVDLWLRTALETNWGKESPERHVPVVGPQLGPDDYREQDYVEQSGANIEAFGEIWVYAVGSSSLLWMTWLDQLHLCLKRLGYSLPPVSAKLEPRYYPTTVPRCDDTKYFYNLKTARYAKIGWSSWDFAFEGWEGCGEDGYRTIAGQRVKCQHGPGCHFSKSPVRVSSIAADAGKSNVTLIASWFNDFEQYWGHFKCFGMEKKSHAQILNVTIENLLNTVRAIHSQNPSVWVVIMAKYAQTWHHINEPWLVKANAGVKVSVEGEPRTLFVEYNMPDDDAGVEVYQTAHKGHPNCRGSQLMAHAVVQRLYGAKVLGRGLRLRPLAWEGVRRSDCGHLDPAGCHTSIVCWLDPKDRTCKEYGPGSRHLHTACSGSVCEGSAGLLV